MQVASLQDTRRYDDWLAELRELVRYRELRVIERRRGQRVLIDGRAAILFCSNDYLNLATDPRLADAAAQAAREYGAGAAASRYISGNHPLYARLETATAAMKDCAASLVFSTGYMANLGVLTGLFRRGDVIFSDAENHASIIDGCRLSRAEIKIFPHGDYAALETLLRETPVTGVRGIVSESLFSMSGTCANLEKLAALKQRYHSLLIIDDAHAVGALGAAGGGMTVAARLADQIDVVIGTYSKAFGGFGGFAAGNARWMEILRNAARSLIYTTALPPAVLAMNIRALEITRLEWQNTQPQLRRNAELVRAALAGEAWCQPQGTHYIVTLPAGSDRAAVALSRDLLDAGFFVGAIRPPTVPEGQAALRISLSSGHTREDIDGLCAALRRLAPTRITAHA